MSSDEQWSDWSEANYIDWEDLQKVYIAERIPESDMNEVIADHTDHDDSSSTEETSEWSSDDGRWDMNVHQYHQYLRNEPCRRIGTILRSEEWNDTDVLNIQNIEMIAREPIFPRTSSPEVEYAALSMEDKIVEENLIECPDENETAIEYSSEEIISSSDEYVPTKSDISSSDSSSCINVSESSDGFEVVNSKKRRRCKKKPKCLFESKTRKPIKQLEKSKLSGQKEDIFIEMKIAEQESLSEYRKRHDINRNHSKRLDVLLKSNALCRQHVPAVGNCFFEAVSKQTTEKIDAITLRQLLCNHIEENANYYGEFLNSAEDNLCNEIELLRQEDSWQNNLSDTMPLAIANLLAVTVKIYSSNPDQPVVVITPSLTETYEKQEITLAYLCVPGHEHYDSVKKRVKGLQLESENELEICDDLDCQPSTADITIEYSNENTSGTPSKVQILLRDDEIITPRKQAKYQSPKKRRLTRKKIANPESWKKNIRKIKCQSGMEYVSDTGKTVKARSIKKHACSKCRFRCADKLSEDERLALFNNYWNLKSYERQRDYISSRVLERNSIGSPSKKRKQVARTFTFIVEGQSVRVCKMFFTATLGISRKTIETALKKKQNNSSPISDKRGKHSAHNRTPTEDLNIIRAHIEAFPVVESHYTRKDTNRKYLTLI
ncbi:Hypothetical predicted protein [Mytilus galloprovincialis]|uniref:OTU domain-containing protein n=1 Tax=Mytilus galloprovincialis TaxID=29158 RepID=A0A8B6BV01_MYTGA|nr:Hypothetical predicted protein [Mytilus galloprovincialis]